VFGDELEETAPEPVGGVERFTAVAIEFSDPTFAVRWRHLTTMRFPDDSGEESSSTNCLIASERIDLELEVLWHELADDDWATQEGGGAHAVAEIR